MSVPPSWNIDVSLSAPSPGEILHVAGWWVVADINPVRIDVLVDGWRVTSARLGVPVPEVAERFARRWDAMTGFEASVDLDCMPQSRRNIDVRVVAVRPDKTHFDLHHTTVSRPPLEGEVKPATSPPLPSFASIYRRDLRGDLLLDANGYPRKLAFIHIPRTAGTFVEAYLASFLADGGCRWYNSWPDKGRDWSPDELLALLDYPDTYAFVHNHAVGWPKQILDRYKKMGWFCFSFVRNPADQLCSLYYWRWRQQQLAASVTLDEFLRAVFAGRLFDAPRKETSLMSPVWPPYWATELDCIAEYSDETFTHFLSRFFGHEFAPRSRVNQSENPGYQALLARGEISEETHRAYLASPEHRVYEAIIRGTPATRDAGGSDVDTGEPGSPGARSDELNVVCRKVARVIERHLDTQRRDVPTWFRHRLQHMLEDREPPPIGRNE